ncbi:acyl carrier protein [Aquimarina sp. BL5]|uniref:phosphopantetheine-binding protein n=1 Tax=Aquimarina sp. BL5 TaxID=1714860 RepID=UPI000E4FA1E0|nr:phosphopantetheine-binding protein [Aquimarina sp. BL5]AXT54188.1 acyl carrier protein [Aquimarina sp. BL5]RKN04687.1 acyl carrier protein [Aquimarina sp. BL5]
MAELTEELKEKLIEQLSLEDVEVSEIGDDDPLFGDGLGLDSIDALELIVLLEKDYGIKLKDPKEGKAIFESVGVMADYISKHRTK